MKIGVFNMKRMHDFYKWLSPSDTPRTLDRRRLMALTHLERSQLANMSSEGTWFVWNAEQSGAIE